MIDSALKNDENYYPHTFLKECKDFEKEAIRDITEDMEIFSRDFMKNILNYALCGVFERAILGNIFLRKQFLEAIYLLKDLL